MNSAGHSIRSVIKVLTPDWVLRWMRRLQTSLRKREIPGTETIFRQAEHFPVYLAKEELIRLQDCFPFLPDYGYDSRSTDRRGAQRAKKILSLPGSSNTRTYLELGCWDGMVSCHLQRGGKQTTAIDV